MKIGFLGVQCETSNLGLAALAYAGINIVHRVAAPDVAFILFSDNSKDSIQCMKNDLGMSNRTIIAVPFRHKKPFSMMQSAREIRDCQLVIDFTGGDSFSDLYGLPRLVKKLLHKEIAILAGTPLILAPQTYGPFHSLAILPWVKHVLRRAELVCARDQLSADYLEALIDREVVTTTDVAVALPWDSALYPSVRGPSPKVGFNISGLLWNGGYTRNNQFGLRCDYRSYCRQVVRDLLDRTYEIHLIPHVLSGGDAAKEDDVSAACSLQQEFPACRIAPYFASPVEAKSYISGMDAFIGSRMHATIASFTTGVPTVPVAYSRKFAGFFSNLEYDVLVDLTSSETQDAVDLTLGYLADRESLQAKVIAGNTEAQLRISSYSTRIAKIIPSSLDASSRAT